MQILFAFSILIKVSLKYFFHYYPKSRKRSCTEVCNDHTVDKIFLCFQIFRIIFRREFSGWKGGKMQILFAFLNLDKSELKKILLSLIPRKAGKVAPKCATITHLYKIYFF